MAVFSASKDRKKWALKSQKQCLNNFLQLQNNFEKKIHKTALFPNKGQKVPSKGKDFDPKFQFYLVIFSFSDHLSTFPVESITKLSVLMPKPMPDLNNFLKN